MKKTNEELEPERIITDEEVKELESELINYKKINSEVSLGEESKPLEFYGESFENQKDFSGYVINLLLGLVHWSVVKYCLEKKIITKHDDCSFAWLANFQSNIPMRKEYLNVLDCPWKEFLPKWNALKNLKDRRLYAQDMEDERLTGIKGERVNKIIKKGREELIKKMVFK